MEGNTLMSRINILLTWITRLAYLNGLWLIFSLLGIVIIGFFPATVAMMTVCRKWLKGEEDFSIFKTFHVTYKTSLLHSNLIGWILVSVGAILYVNYLILAANIGKFSIVSISAFYLFLFFYLITASHAFPLFLRYQGSVLTCIKNAFITGLLNIHMSFAIIVSQSAFFYLMFSYPSTALFFLGSILSIIQIWLTERSFLNIDKKVNKAMIAKS